MLRQGGRKWIKMVKRGVILAAGKGTRLYPITKTQPKEMMPVGRKPAIEYIVEELAGVGISNILIVVGQQKSSLEAYFDENVSNATASYNGACIYFVRQPQPLGTGDAIRRASAWTNDEPFVVALGDCIIWSRKSIVEEMIEVHERYGAAATVAVEVVSKRDVAKYGIVNAIGRGRIRRLSGIVEKPDPKSAPSRLAIAGRYVFSPVIYEVIDEVEKDDGKELGITDAIALLIKKKLPVYSVRLREEQIRMDIGDFEGYFKAFIRAVLSDSEHGKAVRMFVSKMLRMRNLPPAF
ncbi:MAG: hypothetical protein HZRFUVUK_000018 [Candidatus Fervidibacterota bacterium]|jgi:UTP--glucose-1-phosphate uridylyltransferase